MNSPAMLKISPSPSTGWCVEGGYSEQPFVFSTKGEAISFFLVWAEKHQPCDIHIYSDAGELERNISFSDGNHRHASGSDRRQKQFRVPFFDRRSEERRSHV
jgi:hypothetical protein